MTPFFKPLLILLLAVLLIVFQQKARATMPEEVMDATTLSLARCQTQDGVKPCALAMKADKHYVVAFDDDGVYEVYEVDVSQEDDGMRATNPHLLYRRGSGI